MRLFVMPLFILMMFGCTESIEVSTVAMDLPKNGDGPWQIVTYDNERVEREVVVFESGRVYSIPKAVYINNQGQFVFKEGSPILRFNGEKIYWNSQGLILSETGQIVRKSELFSVNSKPINDSTPFLLRELIVNAKADIGSRSGPEVNL